MSVKYVFAVAAGGAIGATLRYMIGLIPFRGDFPTATLIINLVGAFVLGVISGVLYSKSSSRTLGLFLKTGVCGGFTTFSTFSLEAVTLIEGGKILLGAAYIALSLVGGLLGVFLGLSLGKALA